MRERYAVRPGAIVTAWINLIEGLCSHFDDLGDGARDKLARAHALSAMQRGSRLHLLCAAWLAHVDYSNHQPAAMSLHVREALEFAAIDDHSVRSRACMVVAQALHLGSGLDLATPWYAASHRHAVAEGDDLTIAALIHNRGWLQLTRLGEGALSYDGSEAVRGGLNGIASSQAYDELIGAASTAGITPLLLAQTYCAKDQPANALEIFEAHMPKEDPGNSQSRLACAMLADQAWCRMKIGQFDAARRDAIAAEESLLPAPHVDDRAATHSRLAQIYASFGDQEATDLHFAAAARYWAEFKQV
ncbi:MAG: hypothetical protein ABIO45_18385, partial [Burkholderiaceae bacterium]